jgi:hypothetical protein
MSHRTHVLLMLTLASGAAALLACSEEEVPRETFATDLPSISLEVGDEVVGRCWSYTLDNDEPIYVNRVHMQATRGIHHSNWFFVPETIYDDGPDGLWDCNERGFHTVFAAGLGGVLFAQSTQNIDEEQEFLPRTALRIPPRSKLVTDLHLLNSYGEPITTDIHIEIESIPEEYVRTVLRGLALQYEHLEIAPRARSEFTIDCNIDGYHRGLTGRPVDFSLHYLLPHYHHLGDLLRLEVYGGDRDGELVFETTSNIGEPLGGPMNPPFSLAGGLGLRMTCGYDNPGDEWVGWGVGDQEMCVLFGFTDSTAMWGGGVLSQNGNTFVGEADDGTRLNTAPCVMVGADL